MAAYRASHRFARISATKVRPFAKMITGMNAEQGLEQLKYVHNRGAKMLEKVLKSAVANAEDRGARNIGLLTVTEARVDGGPSFKRMQPRARGMAFIIRRRFSHIHVTLDAPEFAAIPGTDDAEAAVAQESAE